MKTKQTALIISAFRGLGLALTEEFLKQDFQVIATVRNDASQLQILKEKFAENLEIEPNIDITKLEDLAKLKFKLNTIKLDTYRFGKTIAW